MDKAPNRHDIRRVVVILAGSRTGSSFLFRALQSNGHYLSPSGEETPFYRRAGIGWVRTPQDSDAISETPTQEILDQAGEFLLRDVGIKSKANGNYEDLAARYLERVEWQWPNCLESETKIKLKAKLQAQLKAYGSPRPNWEKFYADWIQLQEKEGTGPIRSSLLATSGPHPLDLALLEEPPYVAPLPHLTLDRELAQTTPLLLKTSSNLYRINLLRALFPKAEFRWILLHRNPAATIGGLMDGWLSSAFHSHDLSSVTELNIRGYSDSIPGGSRFWKFDLPPNWLSHTQASLAEVCAFQWQSAQRAIASLTASTTEATLHVKYEDLLKELSRSSMIKAILKFSAVETVTHSDWKASAPVVSVQNPQPGKWKKRKALITKTLACFADGELLRLAQDLDYPTADLESWP